MASTDRDGGHNSDDDRALTRIEFLILAVLESGPLHGYGVVQEIARRTGNEVRVRPGSLYRVLDRLMHRGLLELADGLEPTESRRTDYRITNAGEASLRAEARILADLVGPILKTGGTQSA